MGYFKSEIITKAGLQALARAEVGETTLTFTSIKTGDGGYSLDEISKLNESAIGLKSQKQSFEVTGITVKKDTISVRTTISNVNLTEGYYIKEAGVFAKEDDGEEQLIAISICSDNSTYLPEYDSVPIEIPFTNFIAHTGDGGNFTINYESETYVSVHDLKELDDRKMDKETLIDIHNSINMAYNNANQFTLNKIAELINGAPETLDTLKEIADAISEHESMVDALDAAIGKKANQTELDTHTGNSIIHITASERSKLSGIAAGANKYTHPVYTAKSSDLYKITVDDTGHVSEASAVTKEDIPGVVAINVLTCNSITLQANYDGQSSTPIPYKNGYIPIMASPRTAGTNDVVWEHCYISDANVITRLKNTTSASKTFSPTVFVIYVKS